MFIYFGDLNLAVDWLREHLDCYDEGTISYSEERRNWRVEVDCIRLTSRDERVSLSEVLAKP